MPEVEFDFQRDIVDRIARGKRYGKNHFIVLVSEGLFFDVPSNKNYKYCVDNGIANIADFAKRVEKETGVESREAILGHVQRGGAPSAKDRVIATEMGNYCVNLLKNGISNRVVVVMKETDIIDPTFLKRSKWKTVRLQEIRDGKHDKYLIIPNKKQNCPGQMPRQFFEVRVDTSPPI